MNALVGVTVGLQPSVARADVDYEAYIESLPPEVRNTFRASVSLGLVVLAAETFERRDVG